MASLAYSAQDEYGNDITVRLPDWTGQPLLATTATPPDGTLVADGSEVSRASYPELFAKIGTTYGAGDGMTTFALPDWRDEFPRFSGADRTVGSKQDDAIRNISGWFAIRAWGASEDPIGEAMATDNRLFSNLDDRSAVNAIGVRDDIFRPYQKIGFSTDGVVPTADENRPRNVAFLPCIIYV